MTPCSHQNNERGHFFNLPPYANKTIWILQLLYFCRRRESNPGRLRSKQALSITPLKPCTVSYVQPLQRSLHALSDVLTLNGYCKRKRVAQCNEEKKKNEEKEGNLQKICSCLIQHQFLIPLTPFFCSSEKSFYVSPEIYCSSGTIQQSHCKTLIVTFVLWFKPFTMKVFLLYFFNVCTFKIFVPIWYTWCL